MHAVNAGILASLAPEMGRAKETIREDLTTSSQGIDLSQYRGRLLLIQADQTVGLAWGASHEDTPTASLTASQGGVRIPADVLVLHTVTDRAARLGFIGAAAGGLWIAPVSRQLAALLRELGHLP